MGREPRFLADRAWVATAQGGAWASDVLFEVDATGCWCSIEPDTAQDRRSDAHRLPGWVLPGVVNAHSHAFQRAIAGLTERSGGRSDDFWSWRDRMYRAALRIGPAALEAIATQLYGELLAGGYTQVCEFHYLHNAPDGRAYADPAEMSLALVRAAQATGIGLTLLPTLYMRSGFGADGLRDDQRRFASTPASVLRIAQTVNALALPNVRAGLAVHSLRAVDEGALREAAAEARAHGWPVHIHIAEQTREVEDCIAHHGERPMAWLASRLSLDAHWNLVHATHGSAAEWQALAAAGASVVICPTTEANLGDGVFDLEGWVSRGGRWTVGSDSHVSRSAVEELRLLEYSQRLHLRQRNVAARAAGRDASAAALFDAASSGAGAAAGEALGGLAVGHRADFFCIDPHAAPLLGVPADFGLDAWMFSSPAVVPGAVHVGGRPVRSTAGTARAFAQVMEQLWT